MSLPNQHRTPLTKDERVAQSYQDRPGRLLDLALATGNKALRYLAWDLLGVQRREDKRRGR